MTISYFRSTWAASCIAATGGAIYAAVVAGMVSRGKIDITEIGLVLVVAVLVALPVLVAGSAVVGWWISKLLARRVRTNRLMVFTLAGMLMGLLADAILLAMADRFLGPSWRDVPHTLDSAIDVTLLASIPPFYLALAGLVAGAHITHSEKPACQAETF